MTTLSEINLRRHYPISIRLAFMRSFHWIIAFVILLVILLAIDRIVPARSDGVTNDVFIVLGTMVFGVAIILVALKLVYEMLYFIMFAYRIEDQQLLVSKGVIWRSNATFPLFRLTDVYVERNPLELLFFISTLQVTTAASTAGGASVGGIEGLPYTTAIALQKFITELAAAVQPEVSEEKKEEVLREHLPPDGPGVHDGLSERLTAAGASVGTPEEPTFRQSGSDPARPRSAGDAQPKDRDAHAAGHSDEPHIEISEKQLESTLHTLDNAEQDIKRLKVEVEQLKEAAHQAAEGQTDENSTPTARLPRYADPT